MKTWEYQERVRSVTGACQEHVRGVLGEYPENIINTTNIMIE